MLYMSLLLSEKAVEEAVRNCEQVKQREQEEDNVTIEELEKQRVEALEVVEKEREIVAEQSHNRELCTRVVTSTRSW